MNVKQKTVTPERKWKGEEKPGYSSCAYKKER